MVKYRDLISVKTVENKERLVKVNKSLLTGYIKGMDDMKVYFKGKIIVRKTVLERLINIQKKIKLVQPDLSLYVAYGYRSQEIQVKKFKQQLAIISQKIYYSNPIDLYEEVHKNIAVPLVAGHPTGGAVDVTIINTRLDKLLNFGSKIYDFTSNKNSIFSDGIPKEAKKNRFFLRKLMKSENFAPYDGEWWHFSYGDREWAFYYKIQSAIYNQIEIADINKFLTY